MPNSAVHLAWKYANLGLGWAKSLLPEPLNGLFLQGYFDSGFVSPMFLKIKNPLFASLLCMFVPFAYAQTENCWQQHRATVYEWTCADLSLPAEGREFALSIVVVESPKAIMVIDSGPTAAVGESLARAIRSKFGTKPIWILNTQPKPEHVLGNVGFRALFAGTLRAGEAFEDRLVAGKRTADLMRERCPACVENFSQRMGSDAVKGTESLVPRRILRTRSGHLGLLQSDWMQWQFRFYDDLESEQTLVLRNKNLNLWWVGSAVQHRDIPNLYDGNVFERIDFLGRLKTEMTPADTLLTSFGAFGRDWLERNLNYFVQVQQAVLYGLEAGTSEVELIEKMSAQIGKFKNPVFVQTDPALNAKALETHQLNIQRIYRQTELYTF